MRKLSLLLVFAACTSDRPADRDLHLVEPCEFDASRQCERGCATLTPTVPGTCSASNPTVQTMLTCPETFEIEGARGCCIGINEPDALVSRFFECD